VRELVEAADLGEADVVDEAIHLVEPVERRLDQPLRLARLREIGRDVEVADPLLAPAGSDDTGTLLLEQPSRLEPDPAGRPGDHAHLVPQAEIHRAATLAPVTTILLVRHGETDWNRERRWQGHADPPLNETGRKQSRELASRLLELPLAAVY